MTRIALDAMGGDYAPEQIVIGGVEAALGVPDTKILLVGQMAPIQAELERQAAQEAQNLMANAFGRSSSMQSNAPTETDTDVQGTPGSTEGNSSQGKPTGTGS